MSELAHIVSACEERLPFVYLGDEVCVISFVLGDWQAVCADML